MREHVGHPESTPALLVDLDVARRTLARLADYARAHPRIGERVTVIPNHICPCVNLQDSVWLRGGGGGGGGGGTGAGELCEMTVDTRGMLV